MSETTAALGETASTGEGYEALTRLNDGFLGTGYSSLAELSLIGMALIATYVAVSTVKYCWPEFSFFNSVTGAIGSVAGAIGLRDR